MREGDLLSPLTRRMAWLLAAGLSLGGSSGPLEPLGQRPVSLKTVDVKRRVWGSCRLRAGALVGLPDRVELTGALSDALAGTRERHSAHHPGRVLRGVQVPGAKWSGGPGAEPWLDVAAGARADPTPHRPSGFRARRNRTVRAGTGL